MHPEKGDSGRFSYRKSALCHSSRVGEGGQGYDYSPRRVDWNVVLLASLPPQLDPIA